ncbi:hypothetical protein Tco_0789419 [Tanacetum coccineum]
MPYGMLLTRLYNHLTIMDPKLEKPKYLSHPHTVLSLDHSNQLYTHTPSSNEEDDDELQIALVFSPSPSSPLEPHPYITTLDDLLPRNSNPLPLSLFQGHSQGLSQTLPIPTPMDFKPSFPPIKPSRNRMCAQPEPFLSRNQVIQQLRQFLDFDRHIKAAIQTAQNVQNNLLPSFTTTSPQMQPPFHFTTSSTTTIPPFRKSLPPSSTFVPLDQSLWMEGPPYSQPQEHTCPHCQ